MIHLEPGQFVATSDRGATWDMAIMDAKCREVQRLDAAALRAEHREALLAISRQRGFGIWYPSDLVSVMFAPDTSHAMYEGGLPHEGGLLRDYVGEGEWQAYPDDVLAEIAVAPMEGWAPPSAPPVAPPAPAVHLSAEQVHAVRYMLSAWSTQLRRHTIDAVRDDGFSRSDAVYCGVCTTCSLMVPCDEYGIADDLCSARLDPVDRALALTGVPESARKTFMQMFGLPVAEAVAPVLLHPVLQRLQALTWDEIEWMDPDDLRTLLDSLATAARAG